MSKIFNDLLLAVKLFFDGRVPIRHKLVLVASLFYITVTLDLIPDVIPVIGQMDDVAIVLGGIRLFINLAPPEVVADHRRRMEQDRQVRSGEATRIDPQRQPTPPNEDEVIDGEFQEF